VTESGTTIADLSCEETITTFDTYNQDIPNLNKELDAQNTNFRNAQNNYEACMKN
jgi:hypothetical protein